MSSPSELRSQLHGLIDGVQDLYISSFSLLVFQLFEKARNSTHGSGEGVEKKLELRQSLKSMVDSHCKENTLLNKKLNKSLSMSRKMYEEKRGLENKLTKTAAMMKKMYADKNRIARKLKCADKVLYMFEKRFKNEKKRGDSLMKVFKKKYQLLSLKLKKESTIKKSLAMKLIQTRELLLKKKSQVIQPTVKSSETKIETPPEPTKPPPPPPPMEPTSPPPPPPIGGPGGPPPPLPPGGIGSSPTTPVSKPHHVLPSKQKNTVNIRLGVIPQRRLNKSVFNKERLLEKGQEKFWSENMKNILQDNFSLDNDNKNKKNHHAKLLRSNTMASISAIMKNRGGKMMMTTKDFGEKSRKSKVEVLPLIDSQKSLNASIICSKIPNKEKVIKDFRTSEDWIYSTPEGIDTISRIQQVLNLFSPEEEKIVRKKGKSLPEKFVKKKYSEGDRFIMNLFTKVPCIEIKLQLFEFLDSYKSMIFDTLKPELEQLITFCNDLKDSSKFRSFLSLVLVITNFLNQSTTTSSSQSPLAPKEKKNKVVFGISLRSLLNLARVKNPSNKSESLMDVIYGKIILKDDPEMLEFRGKFSPIHEIVQQSQMEERKQLLKTFVDKLKLVKVQTSQIIKKQTKDDDEQDKIIEKMGRLIAELEEEVEKLEKTMGDAERIVEEICDDYGHQKDSIHEFFLVMRDFLVLLDKTEEKHERMDKSRKRLEIRERRKKERLERKKNKEKRILLKKLLKKKEEEEEEEGKEKKKKKSAFSGVFDSKGRWGVLLEETKKHVRVQKRVNSLSKWRFLINQVVEKKDDEKKIKKADMAYQWNLLKSMISSKTDWKGDGEEEEEEEEEGKE